MSEQVVPSAFARRIIVKFITNENSKPAEILKMKHSQVPKCMTGVSH
jgi:hypothetical protein